MSDSIDPLNMVKQDSLLLCRVYVFNFNFTSHLLIEEIIVTNYNDKTYTEEMSFFIPSSSIR